MNDIFSERYLCCNNAYHIIYNTMYINDICNTMYINNVY